MIGVYHATNLALVSNHCAFALQLQEDGVPYPRDVFAVGIAAHAVLEGVAGCANELRRQLTEEEVNVSALGVCERLISVGRSYDGKGEPPMRPEDVFAGQQIALDWLLGVEPCQPGAMVEQGLGLDRDGRPCDYWKGDGLMIRTILDSVRILEESDEESARRVLVVRDYKTAWSADEGQLETLQRKIQAIAAWRYFGPADVLRLEVVNLRLQKVYTKELYAEDGLPAVLAEWWEQIATTVRALEAQRIRGKRPASPGAGCLGCPYLPACPHAQDYIERRGMHQTAETRATAYCVATAMREELADLLRLETDEEPIAVNGGVVGTVAKDTRKLRADAYQTVGEDWNATGGEMLGLLKALALSNSNVEKAARVLYPERGDKANRDAWVEALTEPDTKRAFGVHPTK